MPSTNHILSSDGLVVWQIGRTGLRSSFEAIRSQPSAWPALKPAGAPDLARAILAQGESSCAHPLVTWTRVAGEMLSRSMLQRLDRHVLTYQVRAAAFVPGIAVNTSKVVDRLTDHEDVHWAQCVWSDCYVCTAGLLVVLVGTDPHNLDRPWHPWPSRHVPNL